MYEFILSCPACRKLRINVVVRERKIWCVCSTLLKQKWWCSNVVRYKSVLLTERFEFLRFYSRSLWYLTNFVRILWHISIISMQRNTTKILHGLIGLRMVIGRVKTILATFIANAQLHNEELHNLYTSQQVLLKW